MLLDDLYRINIPEKRENNTFHTKIDLNKEHSIFLGHFPGQPVLPGVCLTNAITDIVSISLNRKYYLSSADFIKFINLVVPEQTPSVNAELKILSEENNTVRAEAHVFFENTSFLKLKGNFELVVSR